MRLLDTDCIVNPRASRTVFSGRRLVADALTQFVRRLAALGCGFGMRVLQASRIVQFTTVAAIALGGSLRQRKRAAQQQYGGQKKNAFFQWFLPWAVTGPL